MDTKNFICPACNTKQKFSRILIATTIWSWRCPSCNSKIRVVSSTYIPTSLLMAITFLYITRVYDPKFWVGCLIALVIATIGLIVLYKITKIKIKQA